MEATFIYEYRKKIQKYIDDNYKPEIELSEKIQDYFYELAASNPEVAKIFSFILQSSNPVIQVDAKDIDTDLNITEFNEIVREKTIGCDMQIVDSTFLCENNTKQKNIFLIEQFSEKRKTVAFVVSLLPEECPTYISRYIIDLTQKHCVIRQQVESKLIEHKIAQINDNTFFKNILFLINTVVRNRKVLLPPEDIPKTFNEKTAPPKNEAALALLCDTLKDNKML